MNFFPHNAQGFQFFQQDEEVDHAHACFLPISHGTASATMDSVSYHISVLRDKVQQLEPLIGMVVSDSPAPHHLGQHDSTEMAASTACAVLQEITAAASAVAYRLSFNGGATTAIVSYHNNGAGNEQMFETTPAGTDDRSPLSRQEPAAANQLCAGGSLTRSTSSLATASRREEESFVLSAALWSTSRGEATVVGGDDTTSAEVVELDASYLLARYTHYCQVCGKGFKRDANLRMHMRAHGDEYKTSAALRNPLGTTAGSAVPATVERRRSYSCPAVGCRWNRRHPRFQPLKSLVCAKNHYRRSHCPKMYACRRCDGKQFAVLSDLRTHEKHCGELRWRCICGTFFSRKDKLMGHVALFAMGHAPVPTSTTVAAAAPLMGRL